MQVCMGTTGTTGIVLLQLRLTVGLKPVAEPKFSQLAPGSVMAFFPAPTMAASLA